MKEINKENIVGVAALLVHAARIDENYTKKEEDIIRNFISKVSKEQEINKVLKDAETLESNSNQLLGFTNLIKKESTQFKSEIIEELWKIIISDKSADEYETNLMRRICGLIYFSDKLAGEIKLKIKSEIK